MIASRPRRPQTAPAIRAWLWKRSKSTLPPNPVRLPPAGNPMDEPAPMSIATAPGAAARLRPSVAPSMAFLTALARHPASPDIMRLMPSTANVITPHNMHVRGERPSMTPTTEQHRHGTVMAVAVVPMRPGAAWRMHQVRVHFLQVYIHRKTSRIRMTLEMAIIRIAMPVASARTVTPMGVIAMKWQQHV